MVYRFDCRYLPYSIHFSEFMPFLFHMEQRCPEHQRHSGDEDTRLRDPGG